MESNINTRLIEKLDTSIGELKVKLNRMIILNSTDNNIVEEINRFRDNLIIDKNKVYTNNYHRIIVQGEEGNGKTNLIKIDFEEKDEDKIKFVLQGESGTGKTNLNKIDIKENNKDEIKFIMLKIFKRYITYLKIINNNLIKYQETRDKLFEKTFDNKLKKEIRNDLDLFLSSLNPTFNTKTELLVKIRDFIINVYNITEYEKKDLELDEVKILINNEVKIINIWEFDKKKEKKNIPIMISSDQSGERIGPREDISRAVAHIKKSNDIKEKLSSITLDLKKDIEGITSRIEAINSLELNKMKTGVLSDIQIKEEIKNGNIIFYNGDLSQVQNSSVNISFGENFYRSSRKAKYLNPINNSSILNYWDKLETVKSYSDNLEYYEDNVRKLGINLAKENYELLQIIRNEVKSLEDKKFMIIFPGETILGHSNEFIGGKNHITTMIKARSSMGRCNITICRDAGWGDIGYINRWTLEITNNSYVPIILPYGMMMAQIVFFYTGETEKPYKGKYQNYDSIEDIVKNWHPSWMLPKNIE